MGSLQDRAASTGKSMQRAGGAMTAGVTAPLAAMGAMSVRVAGNFDEAMQRSIAVMGDVDGAMKERLEATARDVANTTTHSASQAADSYYYLASAGLDAAAAMEAMPQVAAFAEAGQLKMAEATDVATNVMSAYNLEASEMSTVTDTLSSTVSNHNQTMQGMAQAMSTVAPIASSLGLSLEETSAAIGQMGDVGIQGERAGTALRNVFSQLSDESSTVATELEGMGVATRNSSGEVVSLTQLLSNMESAGVEAGDAAKVFGTEAGPAMAALMQQGSDALAQNTQRLEDSEGATKEMAATQRDTLNAEMQIAKSNIQDVGIAIGGDLIPMVSTLTGYISTGADRFQDLNGDQRRAIILLGGVAAAIGPVLFVGGTLLTMLPAIATGWGMATGAASVFAASLTGGVVPAALAANVALGPITVPVWAIIAAIGAAIAIGYGLYRAWTSNFYGVRDTVTDALGTVKGWLDAAPGWMLLLLGPLGQLYYAWRENLFGIQDIVGSVFDWIGDKIGWLIDKIESIPGIGEEIDGEANVDSNMPDAPEEPGRSPVTAPEAMPSPNQTSAPPSTSSTPTPEEAASTAMSSTSWAPSADLVAGASTSASPSAGSAGMSTQEFKTALREVLEGLRLETRLETDQRGLEQWIEDIADAQIAEAGRQR
ncbi:phage tail length tape measure protein [Halorubrum tailed virus]|nr:phage tail length tape measure protein [Halorubrum tailed virus]